MPNRDWVPCSAPIHKHKPLALRFGDIVLIAPKKGSSAVVAPGRQSDQSPVGEGLKAVTKLLALRESLSTCDSPSAALVAGLSTILGGRFSLQGR